GIASGDVLRCFVYPGSGVAELGAGLSRKRTRQGRVACRYERHCSWKIVHYRFATSNGSGMAHVLGALWRRRSSHRIEMETAIGLESWRDSMANSPENNRSGRH